jgi:hypothetical protein
MTAREEYDRMIREEVAPMLRDVGFSKRRNRFRRVDSAGWQVVDFQASRWGSRDDTRFTINLWVGVAELADADADSHVQQRIGALIGDGEDQWWTIEASTDMQRLADEMRGVLEERALPWLEARGSVDGLVELARNDPDEFPRYALGRFGMLLAKVGQDELAREMTALAVDASGPS